MNIVTDTQIFFTQRAGGASVYWYEILSRMIEDEQFDVTMLLANGSYDNIFFNQLNLQGVDIVREPYGNNNALRLHRPKLPQKYDSQGTIWHSSYMRMPTSNCRKVLTVHDFTHQKFFPKKQSIPNTILKRRAIAEADVIVSISKSTQNDLFTLFPFAKKKKNVIIYNGASEDYHKTDYSDGIAPKILSAASTPYILYVGARNGYKNFQLAANAMLAFPEYRLVIVGGEPNLCEVNSSIDYIRLNGVSNNELNYLYNNAVCLLYTSLYEGFGIPVLEAMKTGCPVIALNNSSIPEVLNGSGLLIENDIEECQSCIRRLADENYRYEISSAEIIASKKFSWDSTYNELRELYLTL